MTAKRPRLLISVLLAAALTLTACDVDDTDGDVGDDFATTTTLVGTTTTTAP